MAALLTTATLARLEALSRTLLSPLAATDVAAWQREVNAGLGALLGGTHTLFRLPTGDGSHFTEDGGEIVAGLMAYAQQVTPDMITYWDEAPNVWHRDRRLLGIEAFAWEDVTEVVRRGGLAVDRAPVWNDVFFANGVHDYAGLITTRPEGDAILWSLGPRLGVADADLQRAMLRLLVPAFKAGLDALDRLGAQRHALDAVAEPLAVFDADGREFYRNPALVRLLGADPEGAPLLIAALARHAAGLRRLAFALRLDEVRGPDLPPPDVTTARGRYALRATLLPAGAFGPREALLLGVTFTATAAAPEATRPHPDALRERFGLSRREAEVAALLPEGLTNEAIAERLFISTNTVHTHLKRVYAALDVPGRTAAAARLLQAA